MELIKKCTTLFDLDENDWTHSTEKVIEKFIKGGTEPFLLIYYDEDTLSASMSFPNVRVGDMQYFLRLEKNVSLHPGNFFKNVISGTLDGYPEESVLRVLRSIYAPYIYNLDWPDGIL